MTLLQDSHYSDICQMITDFADEVNVHKTVIENSVERRDSPNIMCVFYTHPHQKDYLVVVPEHDTFANALPKISEALHLFRARGCSAVLIAVATKIAVNDVVYDSVNFFVASVNSAFIYYLPYTIHDLDSNQTPHVQWHDELSYIGEMAVAEMDQNGIDFINTIHAHVHVERAPFEASEVLNYLSYHGFALQALNEHNVVSYIDMSSFEIPKV